MNTVICVAAGLSSRMGAFKPLLPLGDQTIIRTLIATYRSCGIDQVILITGRDADLLEKHVRNFDVLCRRNEQFAETDMFQSVKLGIRAYLEEGKAPSEDDRILLTPCDIPLVSAHTITSLLDTPGDVCIPTMNGAQGHPLCLSRCVLDRILAYTGNDGLQGALRSLGLEVTETPVNDPGMLLDADTPEDYERLKRLANSISE